MAQLGDIHFCWSRHRKPTPGDKWVITIASASSHIYGVFLNSKIPRAYADDKRELLRTECFMSLLALPYKDLLSWNGFIDCTNAYPYLAEELGPLRGRLIDTDLQKLVDLATRCPRLPRFIKGLIAEQSNDNTQG